MAKNKDLLEILDIPALQENSRIKLNQFDIDLNLRPVLNNNLKLLLNNMINAFKIKLDIYPLIPPNIKTIQKTFIDFNQQFNNVKDSVFEKDVLKMTDIYSINLKINNDKIKLNFLVNDLIENIGLVTNIIQSLHVFCYMFKYEYNGLTIDICLDNNNRDLFLLKNKMSYDKIFENLQKKSGAFNVSGVTYRIKKYILLTRSEEIIKLLYHEMVHFIGLDHELLNQPVKFNWATESTEFNLSEAYAEFMSIILNSAYQTIQLSGINNINLYDSYGKILYAETKYSIYLTCNILKFYHYDSSNYMDFFRGIGEKKYAPIMVWEYIFVRTQLLLNLNELSNIMHNSDWRVDESNITNVVQLSQPTDKFIDYIDDFMAHTDPIKNISYLLIDFDWNKF